jgi:hypothetical protein
MTVSDGIVDPERNPFVTSSWVAQAQSLSTAHRQGQLQRLFGKTIDEIRQVGRNPGEYPAFLGIRWGFARLEGDRLVPTEKWKNRSAYDGFGEERTVRPKAASMADPVSPANTKGDSLVADSSKIAEFDSEGELIRWLSESREAVDRIIGTYQERDLKGKNPDELVGFSMDATIYRFFWHERPSERFQDWRWRYAGAELLEELGRVESQEDWDRLVFSLGESLTADWGDRNDKGGPSRMMEGVAMKIVNLVLKHLAYSEHNPKPEVRAWLHVPWDRFTLQPLRKIWKTHAVELGLPSIPKGKKGMGFVENLEIYHAFWELISRISREAGVFPIHYEFLAWDKAHS